MTSDRRRYSLAARTLHWVMAALHLGAVAKHRWLDKHDVLRRMTFGG